MTSGVTLRSTPPPFVPPTENSPVALGEQLTHASDEKLKELFQTFVGGFLGDANSLKIFLGIPRCVAWVGANKEVLIWEIQRAFEILEAAKDIDSLTRLIDSGSHSLRHICISAGMYQQTHMLQAILCSSNFQQAQDKYDLFLNMFWWVIGSGSPTNKEACVRHLLSAMNALFETEALVNDCLLYFFMVAHWKSQERVQNVLKEHEHFSSIQPRIGELVGKTEEELVQLRNDIERSLKNYRQVSSGISTKS